jgi:mannose-6-phosphate isomerase-like protein (cupin superfamily)
MNKNYKIPTIIIAILFSGLNTALSQNITDLKTIQPRNDFENIHIEKIYSDTLSTSFIIWIKKEVKPHKHLTHTESIFVLEGEAEFKISNETFTIKQNAYIIIPPNTVHSVKNTSELPLKVLSIQSPEFDGTDRIQVE